MQFPRLQASTEFFIKFPGPGKSWELKFQVAESRGIHLWFKLTNVTVIYIENHL